jgi:copper chaperone CopZ
MLNQMECAVYELNIPNMSCGHCVGAVNRAIKDVDPLAAVEVNLPTRTVKVQSTLDKDAIGKALAAHGYPPR